MDLLISRDQKYGWIPDLPDQRDFPYLKLVVKIPVLPETIDLRDRCTGVEDQGPLGSCTACALVGTLEFLKKLKQLRLDFSRLFLYYNERLIRKTVDIDSGASLRDGIKSLVKVGDCLESVWPYQIDCFTLAPSDAAYADALKYQILSYYRLQSLAEMKDTLSRGFPFVLGMAVYESFESPAVAKTGVVPMPQATERLLGGHAVMAVGYNDARTHFIVRNSWGDAWGDHGYFYLPYSYLMNKYLASDFWTIRDME